jgi:hypothetical protein
MLISKIQLAFAWIKGRRMLTEMERNGEYSRFLNGSNALRFVTPDGVKFQLEMKRIHRQVDQSLSQAAASLINAQFGSSLGWYRNGHRMRCPNGHEYFIGDCGGADQVSNCADCGALIGGTGHRLIEGNEPVGGIF